LLDRELMDFAIVRFLSSSLQICTNLWEVFLPFPPSKHPYIRRPHVHRAAHFHREGPGQSQSRALSAGELRPEV